MLMDAFVLSISKYLFEEMIKLKQEYVTGMLKHKRSVYIYTDTVR